MARPGSEHPTKLELEILKILWEESPLPVREVRAKLETDADRPLAHSSVITTLNIMYDKGLLRRKKDGKSFLFSPKVKKENVAGNFMGDLLSRLFDGSPSAMMLNLLETTDINSSELAELRKLIARKEKGQSK
ncbi:BlaI/MecI/CopY family transcriptional regulator [Gimesia fumaroli]|jgi:predicted transcriptional regulator|uniref:Penicillinase repressor n=1 Tax=Gimesia fumaroli TaxID=2527976 RepID=A0A518IJN0_9PLAN|nr:BlaI/MecI/CopY family transcriptional regulator [Gimesia fumaroli]QDV53301.1 Penicillinase repressor [Gimesia fumaroli]